KSNFIAAARRAAQAASQDAKGRQVHPEPTKGDETGSLRNKVTARVKTMFLAASIVAIIIGSIQFATSIFDFGLFETHEAKGAEVPERDAAPGGIAAVTNDTETSTALAESHPASPVPSAEADLAASLLAPLSLAGSTPAGPPPTGAAAPPQFQSNQVQSNQ